MTHTSLLILAGALVLSCKSPAQQQAQPSANPNSTAAPSVTGSASAAAKAAWYEGAWQGTYKAELFRIELTVGGVKEWKKDDGAQSSGEGKLSLEATSDGSVTGNASGSLGEHSVTGRIEGDRAALELNPKQAGGFRGVILAAQEGEGLKGTLNASTGDSLSVRQASVVLTRAAK